MEKIFLAIVTKMFGLTENEAKIKFFDEKEGVLTPKPEAAELVYTLELAKQKRIMDDHTDQVTKAHDKGHAKGKAETLTPYEVELKESFGITSDKKGKELHAEIREKLAKGNGQMTDDQVKLHPAFLAMEKKYRDETVPKVDHEKLIVEYNDHKRTVEEKLKNDTIKNALLKLMSDQEKPFILPDDQAKREARLGIVVERLAMQIAEIQTTGGQQILIGKDGKRLETANKNPIRFDDLATGELEIIFERSTQKKTDGSGGGSGDNNKDTGGKKYQGTLPKDDAEFKNLMESLKTSSEKEALATAWTDIQMREKKVITEVKK